MWKVNKDMTVIYWDGVATTVVQPQGKMTLMGEDGKIYKPPSEEHRRIVQEVLEEFDHQLGGRRVGS